VPARGGVARDTRIGDVDREAFRLEGAFELRRQRVLDGEPEPRAERIAEDDDPHRPVGRPRRGREDGRNGKPEQRAARVLDGAGRLPI
jgi:hypothetical protein